MRLLALCRASRAPSRWPSCNKTTASSWPLVAAAAAAGVAGSRAAPGAPRAEQHGSAGRAEREAERLRDALAPLRPAEAAMRERWIEEEKGWAQLPPRAWPPRQPKATEAQGLRDQLRADRCPLPGQPAPDKCLRTMFDLATALAFGKGDPPEGVAMYRAMSEAGDLDSTVALAVCLVEDVAGSDDEHGVRLLRAACARGSAQAWYELGTLLLVGGAGLEEDEPAAFDCFRQAAEQGHSAGMFMMADCLLEGVGCETDAARAVPLLHASAERGHRGARQHLRQLLDGNWWGFDGAAGPTRIVL